MKTISVIAMVLISSFAFAEEPAVKSPSFSPVGVGVWPPFVWPTQEVDMICGVDLSLTGIDRDRSALYGIGLAPIGIMYNSMWGAQAALGYLNTHSFYGMQLAPLNACGQGSGIQVGLLSGYECSEYGLIEVGLVNLCGKDTPLGFQVGALNLGGAVQVGLFNAASSIQIGIFNASGKFQIGLVNCEKTLLVHRVSGFKIGLLNFGSHGLTPLIGW